MELVVVPRNRSRLTSAGLILAVVWGGFLSLACGANNEQPPEVCAQPLAISFPGDGGLYAVAADGTCLTTLDESPYSFVTWSSSGRRFAGMTFPQETNGQLFVVDLDTDTTFRVGGELSTVHAYAWSPDGQQLALVGEESDGSDWALYIAAVGIGHASLEELEVRASVRIVLAGDPLNQVSWSPDGSMLAFPATGLSGGAAAIWTLQLSDRTLNRVAASGILPKWSPDGQHIAYVDGGLWVMDSSGANARELVPPTGAHDEFVWSPDGRQLAISGRVVGESNNPIYVLDLEGPVLTRISNPNVHSISPAWSPDGTRIAFAAFTPDWVQQKTAPYQLWITDPKGETPVQVTRTTQGVGAPQWLPWTQ